MCLYKMMFRQPSRRVQFRGHIDKVVRPPEGSLMHTLLNPEPTGYPVIVKGPVHNNEDYVRLLKRNNEEMGIPYVERVYPECTPDDHGPSRDEPVLEYPDKIQVTLKILKTGLVRIKINIAVMTLYEKYYSAYKKPPMKSVIQAYKSHGFSDAFIEKIKKGYERHMDFSKRAGLIIEKLFDKKPVKKKKKKEVEVEPESDEEEEEDPVPDDGGLDVEPDEDEVVEEEEYISDDE